MAAITLVISTPMSAEAATKNIKTTEYSETKKYAKISKTGNYKVTSKCEEGFGSVCHKILFKEPKAGKYTFTFKNLYCLEQFTKGAFGLESYDMDGDGEVTEEEMLLQTYTYCHLSVYKTTAKALKDVDNKGLPWSCKRTSMKFKHNKDNMALFFSTPSFIDEKAVCNKKEIKDKSDILVSSVSLKKGEYVLINLRGGGYTYPVYLQYLNRLKLVSSIELSKVYPENSLQEKFIDPSVQALSQKYF